MLIWMRVKRRWKAARTVNIEPIMGEAGAAHFAVQVHSTENTGNDLEDPLVQGGSKAVNPSTSWGRERLFATVTRKLDLIGEVFKARIRARKRKSNGKSQIEELNLSDQGGGYGWGLGKRGESSPAPAEQGDATEPVPEYSRY
jgi:hypothetical protein